MTDLTTRSSSLSHQHSPAELGVWVFVFADMVIFAMYFGVFVWEKSVHPQLFAQGQSTLNNLFGAMNTVILLVSSYFMASAVHAARKHEQSAVIKYMRCIKLTMLCGAAFLVVKVFEYSEKFSAGFHVATDQFYRSYFIFTGLHMLHVIVGLSLLAYLLFFVKTVQQIRNKGQQIEGVGVYWHMVDLLWVILFSLIYLVP